MSEIKIISTTSRYNDVGAKMLAKYGVDKNEDGRLELGEVNGDLTIEKYKKIALAGDSFLYTISYLDVLTYEGYKISQAVREQLNREGKVSASNNGGIRPEAQDPLDQISSGLKLEMLDMGQYKIMKDEVSVKLFKTIMEGYKITGKGAEELEELLADKSQGQAVLTWVSLIDAREFVKRLKEQTGRKFRLPKMEEIEQAESQLRGSNWDFTETKPPFAISSYEEYFLVQIGNKNPFMESPVSRKEYHAIRLVEEK